MATCAWCEQEMTTAVSCTVTALHRAGATMGLVPWGAEPGVRARRRCGDCGVQPGGYHHLGCDLQRCPACHGQLISCECRFDEDRILDDLDDLDDEFLDAFVDANGCLTEHVRVGAVPVMIHYDEVPESDITTVSGIRCTTALRTIIDLASQVPRSDVVAMLDNALGRGLFTFDDLRHRLAADDMRERAGAIVLRAMLDEAGSCA
jgi:hypothetical protein